MRGQSLTMALLKLNPPQNQATPILMTHIPTWALDLTSRLVGVVGRAWPMNAPAVKLKMVEIWGGLLSSETLASERANFMKLKT